MRKIEKIIIHCSATPPGFDIGVDEIRKLHTAPKSEIIPFGNLNLPGKAWSDIGYHYVVRRNGAIEPGRHRRKPGAHAKGYNAYSLGICLEGGVDENNKPEANFTHLQYVSLYEFLFKLATKPDSYIHINSDAETLGHRDLPGVTKACPCFNVRAWLNSN